MDRSLHINSFNRSCRLIGLLVLLIASGFTYLRSPIYGDFVQFQMAGLIDRAGAWDALYPVPVPDSVHNAGSSKDSTDKPAAAAIAASHGIDFVPYHFILPPPAAIVFWPFGYVIGQTAHGLWLLLSVIAGWMAAVQAGLILQKCAGRKTKWAGLITLVIACMPAMRRAVMVANLTPMLSVTIGWAILGLMNDEREIESAAAIVLGSVMKYASCALLPIVVVQRRWRILGWAAALSVVWCSITALLMGTGPFLEFARVIAPTLTRSHEMADNISLTGVLLHAGQQLPPLPDALAAVISGARILTLGLILLPMIRMGRRRMAEAGAVCAAAMSLLAWLLIFSPVAWSHYLMYLCPLWGWLASPDEGNPRRRWASWVAMGLIVFSPDQMPAPAIDPWGLHLLASLGLMLTLGITQLYSLVPHPAELVQSSGEHLEIGSLWGRRQSRSDSRHAFARIVAS